MILAISHLYKGLILWPLPLTTFPKNQWKYTERKNEEGTANIKLGQLEITRAAYEG